MIRRVPFCFDLASAYRIATSVLLLTALNPFSALAASTKVYAKQASAPNTNRWCRARDHFQRKGVTLSTVGIEQYKSDTVSARLCHLTSTVGKVTVEYYLNQTALVDFKAPAVFRKKSNPGAGCLVLSASGSSRAKTETCFGHL